MIYFTHRVIISFKIMLGYLGSIFRSSYVDVLHLVTALFCLSWLLQVILPDERKEPEEEPPQARESEAPDLVDGRFCSRTMLQQIIRKQYLHIPVNH